MKIYKSDISGILDLVLTARIGNDFMNVYQGSRKQTSYEIITNVGDCILIDYDSTMLEASRVHRLRRS